MNEIYINPYINFQGNAREAMEFYQSALGGELVLLAFPEGNEPPRPAAPDDRIMHAHLKSDTAVIMGTDGWSEYAPTVGDNVAVTLSSYDSDRISQIFDKLAGGGTVKQGLQATSWGTFGYLADKFGINWMLNVYKEDEGA